jgi:hypothetical protein
MLVPFGENLYLTEGPTVSFYGIQYPTRMAVVRLATGKVWVWSPIALTDELAHAVEVLGAVSDIVSPNKLHHLFLPAWAARFPAARIHAPPGLARKVKQLHFCSELTDRPDGAWITEIDQVVFRGSFALTEVVFFHRVSRTAIFGDLIQRFPANAATGFKGWLMQVGHIVGPRGSTPGDWRLTFWSRAAARAARKTVLAWQPRQLVIAHGDCARTGATEIIAGALSWL